MRVFLRNEGTAFGTCTTHQHVIVMATAQELIEHASTPETIFVDHKHRIRALHHRTGTHVHTSDGHTLEITGLEPLKLRLLPLAESELLTENGHAWVNEHFNDVMPTVARIGPIIGKSDPSYGWTNEGETTYSMPIRALQDDIHGKFVILQNEKGEQYTPANDSKNRYVFYTRDKKYVRIIRAENGRLLCERLTPAIDEEAADGFFNDTKPEPEKPEPKSRPRPRKGGNGKSNGHSQATA